MVLMVPDSEAGLYWNGKMQSVTAKPYGVELFRTYDPHRGTLVNASTSQDITFALPTQGQLFLRQVLAYLPCISENLIS